VEAAVTPHTKAIIPVHIFGMPADMDALNVIARNHKLFIVEDAAQAHGARYKGKRVGQFGAISCFSFYPTKNLGAYGEGGALLTNDDKLAARARSLREHAQSARYVHEEVGYNYRMDSFQAAVLRVKLKRLDAWNAARAAHARRYTELLKATSYGLPAVPTDSNPVWHCYVIECENRDRVRATLTDAGIDTAVNYPVPLHLQPVYRSLGYHRGDLPVAERLCARCLSLPIYPELSPTHIRAVADALLAAA
jgi:dTDP-4-amino-4,6-dideoxygalactose transaminase